MCVCVRKRERERAFLCKGKLCIRDSDKFIVRGYE